MASIVILGPNIAFRYIASRASSAIFLVLIKFSPSLSTKIANIYSPLYFVSSRSVPLNLGFLAQVAISIAIVEFTTPTILSGIRIKAI